MLLLLPPGMHSVQLVYYLSRQSNGRIIMHSCKFTAIVPVHRIEIDPLRKLVAFITFHACCL